MSKNLNEWKLLSFVDLFRSFLIGIIVTLTKLSCVHEWKIISEITTKSRIEVLKDFECIPSEYLRIDFPLMFPVDRKFIQILYCEKCGKLKRYLEDI